jgi:hypothetical protein
MPIAITLGVLALGGAANRARASRCSARADRLLQARVVALAEPPGGPGRPSTPASLIAHQPACRFMALLEGLYSRNRLALFAVDEAHCIRWGAWGQQLDAAAWRGSLIGARPLRGFWLAAC